MAHFSNHNYSGAISRASCEKWGLFGGRLLCLDRDNPTRFLGHEKGGTDGTFTGFSSRIVVMSPLPM